jgi:protein-S-isoprenylcysteine O-methyltransferase Ste14
MLHEKQESAIPPGNKGVMFVTLQVILIAVFVMIPVWRPGMTDCFLAQTALVRYTLSGFFAFCSLVTGVSGFWNLRNFITPFPEPVGNNDLVTSGVYSYIRHPLYSSIMLAGAAWTCYASSLSHLLMHVPAVLLFSRKAAYEEELLRSIHPEYGRYAEEVKRFIPWIY